MVTKQAYFNTSSSIHSLSIVWKHFMLDLSSTLALLRVLLLEYFDTRVGRVIHDVGYLRLRLG